MAVDNKTPNQNTPKKGISMPRLRLNEAKRAGTALLLIACLSLGFLGGWIGSKSQLNNQLTSGNVNKQVVQDQSRLISDLAREVGPSVVSVNVITKSRQVDFFGFTQTQQLESAGTGFIISEDGVVMTNRHVVDKGTADVSVTLSDGTELTEVEIIGRTAQDDSLDIAFLKINDKKGKTLVPAKIGDSGAMRVGDRVIAIGNALGQFQNTVTEGIISGYGRSVQAGGSSGNVETLQNLFQTDAAINQGNSGGPLVNMNGEVIGVNTAVAGAGAQNIGFAIPINDAKGLVKSVLEKGELLRPYLGVRYISLTDDVAFQNNLDIKRGAYIPPGKFGLPSILDNSPAKKAGLQEKDIITKVNDQVIDENHSLVSVLGQYSVGDEVTLTVVRDGQEIQVKVTLEAAPTD